MDLVRRDLRPSRFVTRDSLENAIARVSATGGSTNGVLHLLAIAHEFGIPLDIDEFGTIADRTPIVADLQPGGRYTASDLYDAGGVGPRHARAAQAARPPPRRCADGRRPDASRRSARPRSPRAGQEVVRSIDDPVKATGGLAILHGSLAPDGCVVKLAGHERREHRGPARVFDSETACYAAVRDRTIVAGDVVVIRYEGPVGGPGMQEMLSVTACARRRGPRRLGGAAHGWPLLGRHPRADDRTHRAGGGSGRSDRAGPGGRPIVIDVDRRTLDLDVPADELDRRAQAWRPPEPNYTGGVLAKYAALVGSASAGAVTTGPRMTANLRQR